MRLVWTSLYLRFWWSVSQKNVDFSEIRTRMYGEEGERADH